MHDGSTIALKKLDESHDVHDKAAALATLQRHHSDGQFITGLVYIDPEPVTLHDRLGTCLRPLNAMGEAELCPGSKALEGINAALR